MLSSNPHMKPTNITHCTWPLSPGSGSFKISPLSFSLFLPSFPFFLSGQWKYNLDVYNYTGVSFSVYRGKKIIGNGFRNVYKISIGKNEYSCARRCTCVW